MLKEQIENEKTMSMESINKKLEEEIKIFIQKLIDLEESLDQTKNKVEELRSQLDVLVTEESCLQTAIIACDQKLSENLKKQKRYSKRSGGYEL